MLARVYNTQNDLLILPAGINKARRAARYVIYA